MEEDEEEAEEASTALIKSTLCKAIVSIQISLEKRKRNTKKKRVKFSDSKRFETCKWHVFIKRAFQNQLSI